MAGYNRIGRALAERSARKIKPPKIESNRIGEITTYSAARIPPTNSKPTDSSGRFIWEHFPSEQLLPELAPASNNPEKKQSESGAKRVDQHIQHRSLARGDKFLMELIGRCVKDHHEQCISN